MNVFEHATLRKTGYTDVMELGHGHFGKAFLVLHKEQKHYYVAKQIELSTMSPKVRQESHNEIAILQKLEHSNIVQYKEFFEEGPYLYIIMGYADGGDLNEYIKNVKASGSQLTNEQVMNLFTQIAMAIEYMHARNVIHRDIKAQNVFLTKYNVVKLGDFGLSKVLESTRAMTNTQCGTLSYLSPEICKHEPYNKKSDIWALGVLIYDMISSQLPFDGENLPQLMNEIVNFQPPRLLPYFADDSLWDLISSMLCKDPDLRIDINGVMRHPIVQPAIPRIQMLLKEEQQQRRPYTPEPEENAAPPDRYLNIILPHKPSTYLMLAGGLAFFCAPLSVASVGAAVGCTVVAKGLQYANK